MQFWACQVWLSASFCPFLPHQLVFMKPLQVPANVLGTGHRVGPCVFAHRCSMGAAGMQ